MIETFNSLSACTGHLRALERRRTRDRRRAGHFGSGGSNPHQSAESLADEATASSQTLRHSSQAALEGTTILGKSFEKKEKASKGED
jgi:hypothetical protein